MAPLTYFLLAMNLLVFLASHEAYEKADRSIDRLLSDRSYLETQGLAFASMIMKEPEQFKGTLLELADKAMLDEPESRRMLGGLALRNVSFMSRAEGYSFEGDDVAIADWREKFEKLREAQKSHPSYVWGISNWKDGWKQWVSYQFSHSGFIHLFWNMVFLLIFGSFIELRLGGSFVILTYVGGGVMGAVVCNHLSGVSSSPLVGASAAVSAMMGLVAAAWWKKEKLLFFYWLLPIRGYFGFVALPSWLVVIVSLVPDLSGYLAASRDFGSIAYSAHLGGAVWGVLVAVLLSFGWMENEIEESDSQDQGSAPEGGSDSENDFRKTG
jgi:membrane associated rhomboid family serine protease